MARSIKKGPFVDAHVIEKVQRMEKSGAKKPIKTWSRRSMIIPDFVGHTFNVHNGKTFDKNTLLNKLQRLSKDIKMKPLQ